MKKPTIVLCSLFIITILSLSSCKKIKNIFDDNPDLLVLEQGFKSSAAIGYCASITHMVFTQGKLPGNVTFSTVNQSEYSGSALIYIDVSNTNPLPFNKNIGNIIIAALWDETDRSGVMSITFANIDLLNASFRFYGIHTVPFIEEKGTGDILTVFAQQDIIIGEGRDTILNLSMSRPQFNLEAERATEPQPTDVFAAVKQNVWFVKVDQNDTYTDISDDYYEISGGGQIAEVTGSGGGISYHALIKSGFNFAACQRNPTEGHGFIQNIKAGENVDLGHITLDFHGNCDGKAHTDAAIGKYTKYLGRDVNLNFE